MTDGERPPGRSAVGLVLTFLCVLICVLIAPSLGFGAPCPTCYAWKPLRIGGGGWLTGIDISADGTTRVARTDTYGGYVWDSTQWKQLVTMVSMPAADSGHEKNGGVYELRVAPGNPNRLYMAFNGYIYRSNDRGSNWVRTAFAQVSMDPNDVYRSFGEKMAVDPANADVVYAGTPQAGLWVTTNGGVAWSRVTSVPVSQNEAGITGIVFDPGSGTTGGKTNVIYASSYGNGVWRTNNAGVSWSRLTGGPGTVRHAAVGIDGAFYATENNDVWGNGTWRYLSGAWTDLTYPNDGAHSISPDPFNARRVLMASDGGFIYQGTWSASGSWNGWVSTGLPTLRALDVPWLSYDVPWNPFMYLSNGNQVFDPLVPNKLWMGAGVGVWHANLTPGLTTGPEWTSQTVGIEQLVANAIAAPPGGKPLLASWDRPIFVVDDPDVYPSRYYPTGEFNMGWAVDYASTTPSFVAAVMDWWGPIERTGYSTNGGQSWTTFPTMPVWDGFPGFGTLAVSTPDNIIWVPSNRRAPHYTKDRGQSWQKITIAGIPDNTDGWHWANYLCRHIVAADRVTAGTFYMYHWPNGLYRSTNGGTNWTLMRSGEIAPFSGYNAKLKTVPGKAGHLFFTSGSQSGSPPSGAFMRSTNGGATWTAVPNVLEVFAFGFGKEAPGSSYPTIFIAGWVNSVWGMWRSENQGQSWTQIGDWPLDSFDVIKAVDGDKDDYGTVYVGFGGSGYAYGTIGASVTIDDVSVTEGNGSPTSAVFTVHLSVPSAQTVSVAYATANGTAVAGQDYTARSGTLIFSPGTTSLPVSVPVIGDLIDEPNETFLLLLSGAIGAVIADAQAVGTIIDDDGPPAIAIDDVSVTEGQAGTTPANFTVSLSAPSSQVVTVNYATANGTALAGADYVEATGTVVFPPGSTTKTVAVGVLGDLVSESDEEFVVNLSNPVNGTLAVSQGFGTILDDDLAGLSIADRSIVEPVSGTRSATFVVTLFRSSASGAAAVDYSTVGVTATSGSDYNPASGTLTFAPGGPGVSTQPVNVVIRADALIEGMETFEVHLANPSGASIAHGQATGRIYDPGKFFTVAPCRVLDTRNPVGPSGGPALAAGQSRNVTFAGACGIPTSARVVALNLTVTRSTHAGNLRLHPAGTPLPLASAINYSAGQTRANNAVVGLSAGGAMAVYCSQASGTVHAIVDVFGYFE